MTGTHTQGNGPFNLFWFQTDLENVRDYSCFKLGHHRESPTHACPSRLCHVSNPKAPWLPSPEWPPPPPRLTLRGYQEAVEKQEAMEVVQTLTAGNNYTAQAAGPLQIFFCLLRNRGCGPSLNFFSVLESPELDQASRNRPQKPGFFLALLRLHGQSIFTTLGLGSLRLHFR